MSKGDTFENDLLNYLFKGTSISGLGSTLYVSLHTASPGETGDQTTNECSYTSYARVGLGAAGWTVTTNSVSPASTISFPTATGGTATITHAAVGTASSGTGKILYYGTVTPNISVSSGITPELLTTSTITED